ncbi:MAG: anaerobic ribonucleoside-triphosphate reductase, partial [Clostridia bacterium]|nr:anaerobic ribonucleoside-triphosphate reductase [Clostridia bacterium]
MKVQKRDGRIVTYEVDKITNAIKKANVEVEPSQKASDELISTAVENVENLSGDVIPVETIQDIIERTLVSHNKYVLAKKYMIYRYQR